MFLPSPILTREFTGKNILIELQTVAETAKHFKKEEAEVREILARSRATLLLSLRAKRPRPHLDDKIITAWNGLMISAFARAAQVLDDPGYLERGDAGGDVCSHATLRRIEERFWCETIGKAGARWKGFADDYAFVIQGLLDLYEASFDVSWLQFAIELQETQDRLFFDEERGGYFNGTGKDASILLRMKENNDSAEPAASSVAALNLLRLAQVPKRSKLLGTSRENHRCFRSADQSFPKCHAADAGGARCEFEQAATDRGGWGRHHP